MKSVQGEAPSIPTRAARDAGPAAREEREIAELLPWVRPASHVGRYGWITAAIEKTKARGPAITRVRGYPNGAGERG